MQLKTDYYNCLLYRAVDQFFYFWKNRAKRFVIGHAVVTRKDFEQVFYGLFQIAAHGCHRTYLMFGNSFSGFLAIV